MTTSVSIRGRARLDWLYFVPLALALGLAACGSSGSVRQAAESERPGAALTDRPDPNGGIGRATVESCVAELEASDVKKAVRQDLAHGKTRFFRVWAGEHNYLAAPGIAGCQLLSAKSARMTPVNRFDDGNYLGSESANQCRVAINNYKIRYNQELARILGPSMGGNCRDAPGKINVLEKPFDFQAYRERVAKVTHK